MTTKVLILRILHLIFFSHHLQKEKIKFKRKPISLWQGYSLLAYISLESIVTMPLNFLVGVQQ